MVIITDKLKKYILAEDKKGFNRSEYDSRIVDYALRGIKDLTFLMDHIPETLQAKIFTPKNMEKFFRAMFCARLAHATNGKLPEDERIRIQGICEAALDEIKVNHNGPLLAPNAWRVLKETPYSSYNEAMYGTKIILAIQIEGREFRPERE